MNTVIVFAKEPRLGKVKTRIAEVTGSAYALKLYRGLLTRTLNEVSSLPSIDRICYVTSGKDISWFTNFCPMSDWSINVQKGSDIGQRMANAFARSFNSERKVILIGSDIRDFTKNDLIEAFALLSPKNPVVLGPASDGGYWCIGMSSFHRILFNNIAWSTKSVLSQTEKILKAEGIGYNLLKCRNDVDSWEDLSLKEQLESIFY